MNEREYTLKAALLVWNGDADMPHGEVFDIAQAFAAEARARGLFDEPARDFSPLTPTGAERLRLGQAERDRLCDEIARIERERDALRELLRDMSRIVAERDEARKLVAEMDGFIRRECILISPEFYGKRAEIHRRAKEMTDGQ